MGKGLWEDNLLELIRRTSTDLAGDVEAGLRRALSGEKRGSLARYTLAAMLENVEMARRGGVPICQDTGTLAFYFSVPTGFDTNRLASAVRNAVARATRQGFLRQNTLDPVSGRPYETNVGPESPVLHFAQGARKSVQARLLMKGGGCENVGRQYSLPDSALGAERDLEGVRRCLLDAVQRAQGRGCAPGVLGVCIGGDRASGYAHAKEQFLRKLGDRSPVRELARLEERVLRESRRLEIGPMGTGGRTTLMGVKVGALGRLPASYFVTVSYMCWAFRRRGLILGPEGGVQRWLY